MSLRQRILVLAVGATASVLILFAIPLWLLLDQAATEESREGAVDVARGVADYVSTGPTSAQLSAYVDRLNARDDRASVTILMPDGTRLGADPPEGLHGDTDLGGSGPKDEGGESGDPDGDGLMPVSEPEIHEVAGGQLVSVRATTAGGAAVVLAHATTDDARKRMTDRLLWLGAAAVAILLLVAGAAELVARRLVRDLDRTAAAADRLGDGDLTARAPEDGPPEVRRVSAALNRLAGRIDDLLAAERETVADLSHRLRTPMTAVRLDVEGLPASERTEELEAHLDHLERTLTAVIRAARRPEREGVRPRCDATGVLRGQVDFWRPLAEDQDREVRLDLPGTPVPVRSAADDLRAAIDALMENCIAHTPDGVAIHVVLTDPDPDRPELVRVDVRDRGPGIPEGAVHRGRSDRGSTGLGLDIARACAEASGGGFEVLREDGWSVVRLQLGRP